jgi:molybdate transport system substrate-binding protein
MQAKQNRRHFARIRRLFAALLLGLAASLAAFPLHQGRAEPAPVTVAAAASLKNVLDEIAADWREHDKATVNVVYGASSALARQVEAGLAADIFIAADLDWMDYLAQRGLIQPASRIDLLGNRIVLIAPAGSSLTAEIGPGFALGKLLGNGRLAMANVDAVPAGKYGKAALEKLGVWNEVKDRLAQAENVRSALMLVARGESPLGIVYATDAAAEPAVRIVDTFPASTHPPIIYPAALLAASPHPQAAAFLASLRGPGATAVFQRAGFIVLRH